MFFSSVKVLSDALFEHLLIISSWHLSNQNILHWFNDFIIWNKLAQWQWFGITRQRAMQKSYALIKRVNVALAAAMWIYIQTVYMQPFVSGLHLLAWNTRKDFKIIWRMFLAYQGNVSQERTTLQYYMAQNERTLVVSLRTGT